MKNLKCKGGEPALMTIKVDTNNPLLKNLDVNKTKTKLEKEINQVKIDQMTKEQKEQENMKRLKEASSTFDNEEEQVQPVEEEQRPTGVIPPKYKVVYSYPTDMGDAWGGYTTAKIDHEKAMRQKIPTHITITLNLKWAESMKNANLDINESTLVFDYPELYYLDLNLKYKCDPDNGTAKFDKTKKTMTIKMPVVGLTEDS